MTRAAFAAYWQANGGLAQFGYPLTEELTERLEDGALYRAAFRARSPRISSREPRPV
ncbi:MAG: hypothetical protein U0232_03295 [Thermomicrobiales bacterium]